jgi:ribosomal protein S18 acetylase RimI-like enzyme
MSLTIARGGPDDFEAAVDVYVRSSIGRLDGQRPLDHRVADVADSIRDPESWLFIAKDDEVPVGMALTMPSREAHRSGPLVAGLCYLYLIFVVPERWREGIGGMLLDAVLVDARARGYSRIHLHTHNENERSHALYRSRGFAVTGRTPPSMSDPDATVAEWERTL